MSPAQGFGKEYRTVPSLCDGSNDFNCVPRNNRGQVRDRKDGSLKTREGRKPSGSILCENTGWEKNVDSNKTAWLNRWTGAATLSANTVSTRMQRPKHVSIAQTGSGREPVPLDLMWCLLSWARPGYFSASCVPEAAATVEPVATVPGQIGRVWNSITVRSGGDGRSEEVQSQLDSHHRHRQQQIPQEQKFRVTVNTLQHNFVHCGADLLAISLIEFYTQIVVIEVHLSSNQLIDIMCGIG